MLQIALFSTLCVFVSFIRAHSVIGPCAVELLLWLYSPLLCLGPFFSFFVLYTVGRTPWAEDEPVARPLPNTEHKHRKRVHNIDIHAVCGIRTHDPSVRVSERNSCHCDGRYEAKTLPIIKSHDMKTYGLLEVLLHPSVTSELSPTHRFLPWKWSPVTHDTGGQKGLRVALSDGKKWIEKMGRYWHVTFWVGRKIPRQCSLVLL
jgi:hypothetical protein